VVNLKKRGKKMKKIVLILGLVFSLNASEIIRLEKFNVLSCAYSYPAVSYDFKYSSSSATYIYIDCDVVDYLYKQNYINIIKKTDEYLLLDIFKDKQFKDSLFVYKLNVPNY
jgi:hypothetical protein